MDSRLSMLHIAFTLLLINKGVGKCPEVHDAGLYIVLYFPLTYLNVSCKVENTCTSSCAYVSF